MLGALVSIGGCAAYSAVDYGDLGYHGLGPAYSPEFGYSNFGMGLGFAPERGFHHVDHDFNDRSHADHRFHGRAMTVSLGLPVLFIDRQGNSTA